MTKTTLRCLALSGVLACALVTAAATVGCQQPGSDQTSGGRRSAGTAVTAGKTIPRDATRVAENAHGRLVHRAQRPGTVWVQDATTNMVIYSGQVRADSNIVVDPKADALTINDQQVTHAPRLDPSHRYRLYFRR